MSIVSTFESEYRVRILSPLQLPHPRHTPDISLMWCQEHYSLRPGVTRDRARPTVAFSSIRQLRSAVGQRLTWEATQQPDLHTYLDRHKRLLHDAGRYTDELPAQLHAQGMAVRLGTESLPSQALLDRHVRYLDQTLDTAYLNSSTWENRRELSLAGFANLLLWLGWVRAGEAFSLRWEDITVTAPTDGPLIGLPAGIGVLACRLMPETKTSRSITADVIIAYRTISGYSIGVWATRARQACARAGPPVAPHTCIFMTSQGMPWTSRYFRHTHLYPSLTICQQQGDPYLRSILSISESFWSLHCYRRGARSHVSRRRQAGLAYTRKATPMEVYEHARWQRRRDGEPIDIMYQQWDVYDRIQLTLFCM